MGDNLVRVTIDAGDLTEFANYMDGKGELYMRVEGKSRQPLVPRKKKKDESWQLMLTTLALFVAMFQPLLAVPLLAYVLTTKPCWSYLKRLLSSLEDEKKRAHDYSKQEAELKGAGFTDKKRNRSLLKKHKGDLQKVINELL